MKVGMAVYSASGNTKKVAKQLMETLIEKGHEVDFLEITPIGDPKQMVDVRFEDIFDMSEYDFTVFASFVEAFNLNKCMSCYLKKIDHTPDKKAVMLTTQQFPKKWLGGNQALKKMKSLLENKGFEVLGGEDVNWTSKEEGRGERIDYAVHKLSEIL